jgi:hypothetical protein
MGSVRSVLISLTMAALLTSGGRPATAQQAPSGHPGQPPAQPQPAPMPDPFKLNMLIRGTIVALNQANQTGNYSVLRDLAAPAFRETNNTARLAEIFAPLRARGLDLSPVFFINPALIREPAIEKSGALHVTGYFPSRPQQVIFDMYFAPMGGAWRVIGLAVDTRPTPEDGAAGGGRTDQKPDQKPGSGGRPAAQAKPAKNRSGKRQ